MSNRDPLLAARTSPSQALRLCALVSCAHPFPFQPICTPFHSNNSYRVLLCSLCRSQVSSDTETVSSETETAATVSETKTAATVSETKTAATVF